MPSVARRKVAEKLVKSLASIGYRVNSVRPEAEIADKIWCAEGGATKLDVARWGVDCTCEVEGILIPINIGSWLTLTAASKADELPLIQHSHRSFEV